MNNKIKILHVQHSISFGGVERRRLSLGRFLPKERFEQKIICTSKRGNLIEEIRAEGVEVFEIGELKSPFHWSQHRKVQKIIDKYKPDIIHGAVFEGVSMAAINGWIKKVPIIIIEETSDPQNRSKKANLLMKIFAKISDKVVGVSQSVVEDYLKRELKLPSSKVIGVNNGVAFPRDVSRVELSEVKARLGIKKNDLVIGSVGRMLHDEHKRFSDLINAFALIAIDKINIKLLLVGDGPLKDSYEELSRELNISDKVIFVGYQSDVTLYYKLMDIFALVSAREAFGLVLAEAMLNKLPVIATRVGGMKFIVKDGETGFLVKALNVPEIKEKIEVLSNSLELRNKMGIAGYERAKQEFTEKGYVKKIENLYLNLVENKKKQ
ncbi:glycosyltransferase [Parapedobacter sp. SGR-10]|uniref:glycosyltransferase n=1 Tax=Parapedobacter sp. SGR-10 TaxID=2710879 RepID=UPI0013D2B280|nr:glycosyltransferase [Parapedobacter sp. SGR-10]NGF56547.1 glycosyltransferase [Parapedobacter sp. SGR-10]